jgi:hypothetical protein
LGSDFVKNNHVGPPAEDIGKGITLQSDQDGGFEDNNVGIRSDHREPFERAQQENEDI